MTGPMLDRDVLLAAFEALAVELRAASVVADVYVFGGAAVVLQHDGRSATRDVDAIWSPHDEVHQAAVAVADRLGLPRWWLNDQASVFLSTLNDLGRVPVFETANLRVATASVEHMIAMKAFAGRFGRDFDDLVLLCRHRAITTVAEVVAICQNVFPTQELGARQVAVIEDVIAALGG